MVMQHTEQHTGNGYIALSRYTVSDSAHIGMGGDGGGDEFDSVLMNWIGDGGGDEFDSVLMNWIAP